MSIKNNFAPVAHERSHDSLATPEVQSEIEKIADTEQDIDAALHLIFDSKESVEATDEFLIDNAEQPDASLDEVKTALLAGALELTGNRTAGDINPISVLELDGYSGEITEVVRELNELHAILPSGEDAASVLAIKIDGIAAEHDLNGGINLVRHETKKDIPKFDKLDDYSKEFPEQLLMHRSNAELQTGDIVLPSDQISAEEHKRLNGRRSFSSTSSPGAGHDYDNKLAHAGTRDFGEIYGQYLYVVEPLEDDTLKWGENFGADVDRSRKVESDAFSRSGNGLAATDSHTGKWHNEVVSTKGFRVVEKILHEPSYRESMLPWPVSAVAAAKHEERSENKLSNVAFRSSDISPGFGKAVPIRTTARKRPGKIGPTDTPGTYRAGANESNPSELRTKFDVMKQYSENPGQYALPGMSINKYGAPDRWNSVDPPYHQPEQAPSGTVLPGMEEYGVPSRPLM